MRESNYTYPPQNRAVISITQMLYDRRALDTSSPLALLNNLTSLTYLTSTSPRIREILTCDGGLERLLDILRDSCLPLQRTSSPDLWGLNGPPTARVIEMNRQISLRHSLAFQCVVNIGVRGSEAIRTRVVQAGALDIVAQILESWLKERGISIFAGSLGSQAAVDAVASGRVVPGTENRRMSRSGNHRHTHSSASASATVRIPQTSTVPALPTSSSAALRSRSADALRDRQSDTDVDMADAENENDESTDAGSLTGNDMDVDEGEGEDREDLAPTRTTPRASTAMLPLGLDIPPRPISRDAISQGSSAGNSVSGDDEIGPIPRAVSDNNLANTVQAPRPIPINIAASRLPQLAQDPVSNQSSPMGTPTRMMNADTMRPGRRGTIVGRPVNVNLNLAPRNDREHGESGTSDGGEDVDLPTATINAGIASANAAAMEAGGTVGTEQEGPPPDVEIVDNETGGLQEESDADFMAAEQARLDLEAGAPPGQPGAVQTPRVIPDTAAPQPNAVQPAPNAPPAQIIIANGAPRGFQDLGSYVGISSLLNPDGGKYSDDSILLALQLLAYLSKYPHVRSCFHHPRRPMHPTFNLGLDYEANPLPERPPVSETPNIFSLVERYTFRPSAADPLLFRVPAEIQYWAGVIMRNACRKDEAQGGIRQCANMSCGRWEASAREFAKCRRCRKAKYCSKECQSRAWQEGHRFWCNAREDVPPPGPGQPTVAGAAPPQTANEPEHEGDDLDSIFGQSQDLPRDVLVRALEAAHNLSGRSRQARTGDPAAPGADPARTALDSRTTALFNFVRETLRYHIQRRTPEEQQIFFEFIRSHPNSLRGLLLQAIAQNQNRATGESRVNAANAAITQGQVQPRNPGGQGARGPVPPVPQTGPNTNGATARTNAFNITSPGRRGPALPAVPATTAGRSLWGPARNPVDIPSPATRGIASIDAPNPLTRRPPTPPQRTTAVGDAAPWSLPQMPATTTRAPVLPSAGRPAASGSGASNRVAAGLSSRTAAPNSGSGIGVGMGLGIGGTTIGSSGAGPSMGSRFSLSEIWRGMRSDRDSGPSNS